MNKDLNLFDTIKLGSRYINAKLFGKRVPLIVSWALTYRCNHKCVYCNLWKKEEKELTTQQVFGIIDELNLSGTQYISFTGGEPLVREDIGSIINYALSKNIKVRVNSNGSLVNEKIDSLKGIDKLNISLNGPEEIHDSISGKGSFKQAITAVETAQKNGIKVAFITVLSRININSLDFVLLKAKQYGVKVNFQPVTREILGTQVENTVIPDKEQYQRAINMLQNIKKLNSGLISNTLPGLNYLSLYPKGKAIKCASGWLSCRIEPDGSMVHCSRKPENSTNCTIESVGKAFSNLHDKVCENCWCSTRVELNMQWSYGKFNFLSGFKSTFTTEPDKYCDYGIKNGEIKAG
ncbi:MAG: hypothetical protein A2252_05980 [Elusimicrobia bacterium RIFOXYA2_FULL_39_19]|nr:MAG: hypothetical protein A2252_05980 [Elusimicrobia bacterium RIFOXYA2_FULL_39_19]